MRGGEEVFRDPVDGGLSSHDAKMRGNAFSRIHFGTSTYNQYYNTSSYSNTFSSLTTIHETPDDAAQGDRERPAERVAVGDRSFSLSLLCLPVCLSVSLCLSLLSLFLSLSLSLLSLTSRFCVSLSLALSLSLSASVSVASLMSLAVAFLFVFSSVRYL